MRTGEPREITMDEWRLIEALWTIADLPSAEVTRAPEIALRALTEANEATQGAIWRRMYGAIGWLG